ncbi:hypothetical protein C0992_007173 [Termitomyces sp. T32_za158]|nr:hypothetical protein C0992_007173 [Termitomyces sp. T32_za158]
MLMFQSTAPGVHKRSMLFQDSVPPEKKRKEGGVIPDDIHDLSDRSIKINLNSTTKKEDISNIINMLWYSVAMAEVEMDQKPQAVSVLQGLRDTGYLGHHDLPCLIDESLAKGMWRDLREHGVGAKEIILPLARSQEEEKDEVETYAQVIPIVQSSGTGKSRMIDELSKELIVIPLNLRPHNNTGKAVKQLLKESAQALASSYARDRGYEAVVIAFDEVHGLFNKLSYQEEQNVFYCLGRMLNAIRKVKALVSLFLSTSGEVCKYAPPVFLDPSARVKKHVFKTIPPFTEIGFNQLAVKKVGKDEHLLRDMVSIEWMCQFGQPLFGTCYNAGGGSERDSIMEFAATKLLGGCQISNESRLTISDQIAILATCLSLCFDHLTSKPQMLELEQVEHHMRLCLTIKYDNKLAITIVGLEPILAEDAHHIIRRFGLDQVDLLNDVLSESSLDRGDRSEMVALLLFILARDAVIAKGLNIKLIHFLDALLQSDQCTQVTKDKEGQYVSGSGSHLASVLEGHPMFIHNSNNDNLLEHCFEHLEVHFNHFIRAEHTSIGTLFTDSLHVVLQ